MTVRIIGLAELLKALAEISGKLKDRELLTRPLAKLMTDYVHRDTGYLASTIYSDATGTGARAPYAGYEEERGGDHAFGSRAIEALNMDAYLNAVVEPF